MKKIIFFISLSISFTSSSQTCADFYKKINVNDSLLYNKCAKECSRDDDCTTLDHGCDTFAINKSFVESYPIFMDQFHSRECKSNLTKSCQKTKCLNTKCILENEKCVQITTSSVSSNPYNMRLTMIIQKLQSAINDPETEAFKEKCPESINTFKTLSLKLNNSNVEFLKYLNELNSTYKDIPFCRFYVLKLMKLENISPNSTSTDIDDFRLKINELFENSIYSTINSNSNENISSMLNAFQSPWMINQGTSPPQLKLNYSKVKSNESRTILFSIKYKLARLNLTTMDEMDSDFFISTYLPLHADAPISIVDSTYHTDLKYNQFLEKNPSKIFQAMNSGHLNSLINRPYFLSNYFKYQLLKEHFKDLVESKLLSNEIKCSLLNSNVESFLDSPDTKLLSELKSINSKRFKCPSRLIEIAKAFKTTKVNNCNINYLGSDYENQNNNLNIQIKYNDCLAKCSTANDCENLENSNCSIIPGNRTYLSKYQTLVSQNERQQNCIIPKSINLKFECIENICKINRECSEQDLVDIANKFNESLSSVKCEMDYQCSASAIRPNNTSSKILIGYANSGQVEKSIRLLQSYISKRCSSVPAEGFSLFTAELNPYFAEKGKCVNNNCSFVQVVKNPVMENFQKQHMPPSH